MSYLPIPAFYVTSSLKLFILPDYAQYDEKALLAEVSLGDQRAFRALFDRYKQRFYSTVLKMTGSDEVAQDIVQDVFLKIWTNRENLGNIDNPSAYFFTSVYRRVYQHYRKVALERKILQVAAPTKGSVNTTDEMVLAHESRNLISQAVAKLPPQQQLVFKLSKEEGLSREDVASQLKISPHTVRNHLADAIKSIRVFLQRSSLIFLVMFWVLKKIFFWD